METFDIQNLPKEALFSLLLQIEPVEIKTVCFSRNKKVREICNSEYFRETYKQKYRKVNFRDRKDLTEKDFQSLKDSYYVDLGGTNVTDDMLKYLKGIHTIDLFETKVTDEGLKYLTGVHTIFLGWTKVTDEGLKYLAGVHTIFLYGTKVTDQGMKYLRSTGTENIYR